MKIAVSGKGGVGKTTFAAGLCLALARNGNQVYAVDADPDANLGLLLGIDQERISGLVPLAALEDEIKSRVGEGMVFKLNPRVDDILDDYSINVGNVGNVGAQGGIKLLKMGAVKKGGSDCYCREHTFVNALMNSLLLEKSEVVVMDMSAGIENLTRGTAGGVDVIIVVVEPGRASIQTAKNVRKLSADLGIKNVKFVMNKIASDEEVEMIKGELPEGDILAVIPFDMNVRTRGAYDDSLMDEVMNKLLKIAG